MHDQILSGLHGDDGADAQLPEDLVGDAPELAVLGEGDEILPVQFPQVHRLVPGQPVPLVDQQDDLMVPDVGGLHPGVVHLGGKD